MCSDTKTHFVGCLQGRQMQAQSQQQTGGETSTPQRNSSLYDPESPSAPRGNIIHASTEKTEELKAEMLRAQSMAPIMI